tara:strand:+ start:373 stop:513 length:141 start_codon:yes stop_codon:yes gene_type:complete
LLKEADPLEDDDIYQNERKKEPEPEAPPVDYEETEFEDDIGDLLDK